MSNTMNVTVDHIREYIKSNPCCTIAQIRDHFANQGSLGDWLLTKRHPTNKRDILVFGYELSRAFHDILAEVMRCSDLKIIAGRRAALVCSLSDTHEYVGPKHHTFCPVVLYIDQP